eukprot:scaffold114389_cov32-Tisochrysis_lutea.AAC.4
MLSLLGGDELAVLAALLPEVRDRVALAGGSGKQKGSEVGGVAMSGMFCLVSAVGRPVLL